MNERFGGHMMSEDPDGIEFLKKGLSEMRTDVFNLRVIAFTDAPNRGGTAVESSVIKWFDDLLIESGNKDASEYLRQKAIECAEMMSECFSDIIDNLDASVAMQMMTKILLVSTKEKMKEIARTLSGDDPTLDVFKEITKAGGELEQYIFSGKDAMLPREDKEKIKESAAVVAQYMIERFGDLKESEEATEIATWIGHKLSEAMARKEDVDVYDLISEAEEEFGIAGDDMGDI